MLGFGTKTNVKKSGSGTILTVLPDRNRIDQNCTGSRIESDRIGIPVGSYSTFSYNDCTLPIPVPNIARAQCNFILGQFFGSQCFWHP